MADNRDAAILVIPGLREHVDDHWQSYLAIELSASYRVLTVPALAQNKLDLVARLDAISECMLQLNGPVVLVAHSAGCLMLVHWVKRYGAAWTGRVRAALLVTPPDLQQNWPANYPSAEELTTQGWAPLPDSPLPFPALVVSSCNDHLASAEAVAQMARNWHSALLPLGAVGHLNPASGYGQWPLAATLVRQLSVDPFSLCRTG